MSRMPGERARARRARAKEAEARSHGRAGADHGGAVGELAQEVGPVGVGDEQHAGLVGQVVEDQGVRVERAVGGPRLGGGQQDGGQRDRRLPAGPQDGGGQDVRAGLGEQVAGQLFEVALVGPAAGGEFVGVARGARGGELVDVGEGQLGELGDLGGGQARRHRARGQAPPGHPGADAVGAEQGVHRAAVAHLAAPQLVGRVAGVAPVVCPLARSR
ncbi:hypothetical protein GCM10020229_05430 [Kitasatospora albolonga]